MPGASSDPHPRREAFARRSRELREERGWSQEKLALTAGVDRSFLAEVETAKISIALDRMIRLADALDVGVVDFFVADAFRQPPRAGGAD